jgi:hypothetical protein
MSAVHLLPHYLDRTWTAAPILLVVLMLCSLIGSGAAQAEPLAWSAPQLIDHESRPVWRLNSVSCPSTSLCVAVDEAGHVLTSTNPAGGAGAWSAPVSIDPGKALDQVSCPSMSLCVAVDDDGSALVSTNPTGGAAAWKVTKIDPNAEQPLGGNSAAVVSCPTTSFCVVVDTYNDIITTNEPTGGASAWTLSGSSYRVITNWGVVACPSTSLCITTDGSFESGNYFYGSTEPAGGFNTWKITGTDTNYSPGGAESGGAACPSTELCVMGDNTGHVLTTTKPAEGPWTNTNLPTTTSLRGITGLSCASTSFCVAVDAGGEAITTTDPAGGENAWTPADVDGTNLMTAVSCPTTSFCVATDDNGKVIVSSEPTGGATAWTGFRVDESTAEEEPQPKEEPPHELPPPGKAAGPGSGGSSGGSGPGTTTVPNLSAIKALLSVVLLPRGKAAKASALLKHGGYTMHVTAPAAGTLTVQWYGLPKGAKLAKHAKAKPVLVASGQAVFQAAGVSKSFSVKLTAQGRRLLKHAKRLSLTAKGTFTVTGGPAVSETWGFGVAR